MILRDIKEHIQKRISGPKAVILSGPRGVGKSTLINELEPNFKPPVLWWNGDDADIRELLQGLTAARLRPLIGQANTLIIKEAQRTENINQLIKLITDNLKQVKVIVTGSASFALADKNSESLTGRNWEFKLFPLSFSEMVKHHGLLEEKRQLTHRLIFGYYPDIVTSSGEEISRLKQMSDQILYKDIFVWERIVKPEKLEKLVQTIAWQIGKEVSYYELGRLCDLDNQTVEKYVQLLEKAFIIHNLPSFNRSLPNELKKSRKLYFYDNGLRNAVINQFNTIENRNDTEALWENFLINERLKFTTYQNTEIGRYFWRTHAQQEIGYVEERSESLAAYAFKWDAKTKARFPKAFREAYHPTKTAIITKDNFFEFVGVE
ncbi:ATP-binding protein [Spirosoma jeollabukense]